MLRSKSRSESKVPTNVPPTNTSWAPSRSTTLPRAENQRGRPGIDDVVSAEGNSSLVADPAALVTANSEVQCRLRQSPYGTFKPRRKHILQYAIIGPPSSPLRAFETG